MRIDGRSLGAYSMRERARRIAYVPQAHAPTFAFTVETVVLMGRTAHGSLFSRPRPRDRAVAARALAQFGIAHLAQRPYTMISGGERQLVLLARALAQEPQFVVLDEPTASLDFGNQGKVMREIRALAASGHGVLFTTHDPNHALRAADRAFLLRDGRASRRRHGRRGAYAGAAGGALWRAGRAADRYGHRGRGLSAGMKEMEPGRGMSVLPARVLSEELNYGTRPFALAYRHSAADYSTDLAVRRPARLSINRFVRLVVD